MCKNIKQQHSSNIETFGDDPLKNGTPKLGSLREPNSIVNRLFYFFALLPTQTTLFVRRRRRRRFSVLGVADQKRSSLTD